MGKKVFTNLGSKFCLSKPMSKSCVLAPDGLALEKIIPVLSYRIGDQQRLKKPSRHTNLKQRGINVNSRRRIDIDRRCFNVMCCWEPTHTCIL